MVNQSTRALARQQAAGAESRAWGTPAELAHLITTCDHCGGVLSSAVLDATGHAAGCEAIDKAEAEAVRDEGNSSAVDIRETVPACGQWDHEFIGYPGGAWCAVCGLTVDHREVY